MLLLILALADTMSGASPSPVAAPAAATATATGTAAAMPASAEPTPPTGAVQPASAADASLPQVPETAPLAAGAPPAAPVGATASLATGDTAAPPPPGPGMSGDATETIASGYSAEPRDPWVKVNRAIFSFDVALEKGLLAPVAHGYNHVVPRVVRYHVTSALFNLEEPLTAINDLLQLRFGALSKTVYRFLVNSTVGVAGLFDVAKTAGVPIHFSLFGQTLGRYGVKPGPYVMLPILGPSDVRDGIGRLVDGLIDPVQFLVGGLTSPDGLSLFVLEGVDWRSRSDDTLKAVYSATDPYAFVRSAYTQSRIGAVSEATGKAAALPDFDAGPGTP